MIISLHFRHASLITAELVDAPHILKLKNITLQKSETSMLHFYSVTVVSS